MFWNRIFKTAANDDYEPLQCHQCSAEWSPMIFLKDALWLSIAQKEEFLCWKCIEKRLGRPLTGWDLKDVPQNHQIWRTLMYQVLQHTSYGEAYRRIVVENRTFDPTHILLELIRGYAYPSQIGLDDEDTLAADKELNEAQKRVLLSKHRSKLGVDTTVNDNDPDADLQEPAA